MILKRNLKAKNVKDSTGSGYDPVTRLLNTLVNIPVQ
jgi:hypothetical protein